MARFPLPTHTEALTDEHIIPFALGGRWVVPKSSCAACARATGAFEQVFLRTMLGPLRMYFDMPTRRRKARPKKLPLKVKLGPEDDWTFVDVDQEVAAEVGIDAFEPFLRRIICQNETSNVVQYIGGIKRTEKASTELLQISIVTHPKMPSDLITVRIRLLAC
ncbi:HNH endonuclease [Vineibacter terrae]|uniref:HNH endonuclease n=1 Tax=Vineibacter terrae TaxID=2586908 RepID=A0A5C8PF55_9HYPH|nr:HNH endonuclease [Vineibacter terrae]TXL71780.1 HNH endonuclease [Vineibacter terrae]